MNQEQLDSKWIKLLQYVQLNPYCTMEIEFKDGKPVLAEHIKESIKF